MPCVYVRLPYNEKPLFYAYRLLNSGAYGTVVYNDAKKTAIKIYVNNMSFISEYFILKTIGYHPYIVKIHDLFICDVLQCASLDYMNRVTFEQVSSTSPSLLEYSYPAMELQYCDGSLEACSPKYLTDVNIIQLMLKLVATVNHLHRNNIIHRDIKASNILYIKRANHNNDVEIIPLMADFGSAVMVNKDLNFIESIVTTITSRAPEITEYKYELKKNPRRVNKHYNYKCLPYTEKVDCWALGCVLLHLCTGEDFYDYALKKGVKDSQEVIESISGFYYTFITGENFHDTLRNAVDKHSGVRTLKYMDKFKEIAIRLLNRDYRKRPSTYELYHMILNIDPTVIKNNLTLPQVYDDVKIHSILELAFMIPKDSLADKLITSKVENKTENKTESKTDIIDSRGNKVTVTYKDIIVKLHGDTNDKSDEKLSSSITQVADNFGMYEDDYNPNNKIFNRILKSLHHCTKYSYTLYKYHRSFKLSMVKFIVNLLNRMTDEDHYPTLSLVGDSFAEKQAHTKEEMKVKTSLVGTKVEAGSGPYNTVDLHTESYSVGMFVIFQTILYDDLYDNKYIHNFNHNVTSKYNAHQFNVHLVSLIKLLTPHLGRYLRNHSKL